MNFFDTLEALCSKNDTNVTTVLKDLGYSTSKGTAWRNGSIPTGDILLKLAQYFDISIDYLLTGKEKSPSSELSEKEQKLIVLYKDLTEFEQGEVIGYIKKILEEHPAGEKGA